MNPTKKGGKVFVIIATNDPELLDEALTRPGRIDLKLAVLPPDVKGRKAILETHTKSKPLAPDVDLDKYAKAMYGHNGAALEALANNAALEAGSHGADAVNDAHFDHALTVMQSGPARKHLVVTEHDKQVTAAHEAGHTLCAAILEHVANPTSVTILAHGYSGGHTRAVPDEEVASQYTSREAAKQQLIMLMGGVAGEKLVLNADFTNGASSDRRAATERAIEMVCHWGMGTYNSFFNENWRTGPHADEAWGQVEALLDKAERAAILLLLEHKTAFDALVQELLEKETLRADDLQGYRPAAETPEALDDLKKKFAKVIDSVEMRAEARDAMHHREPNGKVLAAIGA
jgi:cell division protease FtsH